MSPASPPPTSGRATVSVSAIHGNGAEVMGADATRTASASAAAAQAPRSSAATDLSVGASAAARSAANGRRAPRAYRVTGGTSTVSITTGSPAARIVVASGSWSASVTRSVCAPGASMPLQGVRPTIAPSMITVAPGGFVRIASALGAGAGPPSAAAAASASDGVAASAAAPEDATAPAAAAATAAKVTSAVERRA
jgi:hypothetical protein